MFRIKFIKTIIAVLAVSGILRPVWGGDTLAIHGDRVRVSAPTIEDRSPTIVTSIRMDGHRSRHQELTDILAESPGLVVQRTGGAGSRSLISIRGLSSDNVRIYVDGILLNDQLGGGADIGGIPVDLIESVDIYRGVVPAEFGGSGVGGAIHIKTIGYDRKTPAGYALQASYGSQNSYSVHGKWYGPVKNAGLIGAVTVEGSDNNFQYYKPGNNVYLNPEAVLAERRNNAYRAASILLKARSSAGIFRIDAKNDTRLYRKGEPGHVAGMATESVAMSGIESRSELVFRSRRLALENASVSLQLHNAVSMNRFLDTLAFRDENGDISKVAELFEDKTDIRLTNVRSGMRLSGRIAVGSRYKSALFFDYQYEAFGRTDVLNALQNNLRPMYRHLSTVSQSNSLFLAAGKLQLNTTFNASFVRAGLLEEEQYLLTNRRLRVHDTYPGYSVSVKYLMSPGLTLRCNGAGYYRMPSAVELFGTSGSLIGDPDLKPERGYIADGGLRAKCSRADAGVAFFITELKDMILYLYNSEYVARPANIGAARIYGIESSWRVHAYGPVTVSGNATWQEPRNLTRTFTSSANIDGEQYGKMLPFRPRWMLFNRAAYAWKTLELFHEYRFTGTNFTDALNVDAWGRRHHHTAGITWHPSGRNIAMSLEARNLLNEYSYDLRGYPLPGFQVFGQVTFGHTGSGKKD